jgi:hypothetical protein
MKKKMIDEMKENRRYGMTEEENIREREKWHTESEK